LLGGAPVGFPVIERGDDYVGVLGVGAVNGFGVVAKGLLSEAFGIAAGRSTFSPAVAVGVEGHALDARALAALFEFGGAIAGAHSGQVREERAGPGPALQDGSELAAEPDKGGPDGGSVAIGEFAAGVAERALVPVDVLRPHEGRVTLRSPGVPEELVEVEALGVVGLVAVA